MATAAQRVVCFTISATSVMKLCGRRGVLAEELAEEEEEEEKKGERERECNWGDSSSEVRLLQ